MFYFVGAAVSKGERSRDESSESVDSDEEADGSGSEHNEPETKNTGCTDDRPRNIFALKKEQKSGRYK